LKSRPALLLALIGLLIAAALWHWRMSFPFDDAYITFRYAENLANGNGIVWNAGGPHTEGYTNFLLVLILSPFAFFHADLLVISQLIGIIAAILTSIVIYKFVSQIFESNVQPIVASIIYLMLPFTWANAFSGLETSLFVLMVTSSFYFTVKKKWNAAFILATLSCLTRPDGVLAGLILAISILLDKFDRIAAFRAMLTYFVLPMLLYASFKFFYFGALLPNSFYIKTGSTGLHGIPNLKSFIASNIILIICSLYGLWRYRNSWKTMASILIWSGGIVLFYLWPEPLQGFYFRFDWPAIPVLAILTALAIASEKINCRTTVLLILVIGSQIAIDIPRLHLDMELATLERGRQIYHELGLALQSIPDHKRMTFAFQDAGAVPYYSEMKNIDLVGLNTTAIARSESAAEACHIVDSLRPDIILIPAYHDKNECWEVFHDGHGKAAALILAMIQQPMMSRYVCTGRISYLGYDILCYTLPDCSRAVSSELGKYSWFVPGAIPCIQ
jgi:arabinofuranosyltransferase